MTKIDLDKLLDDFNKGKKDIIYYYLVGMWLVTEDYTRKGYVIDMMVCKGLSYKDAIEEALMYEGEIKNLEAYEFVPLTIGESVLEATINASYFNNLLSVEEVYPDDKRIQKSFKEMVEKEKLLNEKNK